MSGFLFAGKLVVFFPQFLFSFHLFRIERNAVNRANLLALGLVKMADTFGAFCRIYNINIFALGYCLVRAFRFTDITVDTFFSDF